jgi:DNA-directed RNA polymerase specialized sigma24 family protein
VKIYRAWPRIERTGLEAYARRAVVNESLCYVTRRPRDVVVDTVPEAAVPETTEVLDLGAALSTLPAQQRAVIALRFVDDRSVAETAAALGIAEGTVKRHTSKAIATRGERGLAGAGRDAPGARPRSGPAGGGRRPRAGAGCHQRVISRRRSPW